MLTSLVTFFQEMTVDRVLAIASCIIGIVAIFVGGKAYHKCKIVENSFNDRKEFKDHSIDCSEKAETIINNNGVDIVTAIKLANENISTAITNVRSEFKERQKENTSQILIETKRLIDENKINLGEYTKLDWINVYLDASKNTSEKYMQNVWAKILARELTHPNSFSYQTIDIVRKMTESDFKLFELMCSFSITNMLLSPTDMYDKYGLPWVDILKLKEFGLINMELSKSTYIIKPQKPMAIPCNGQYQIIIHNKEDKDIIIAYSGYDLTYSAQELLLIVNHVHTQRKFIAECINKIKTEDDKRPEMTLHEIISDNQMINTETES